MLTVLAGDNDARGQCHVPPDHPPELYVEPHKGERQVRGRRAARVARVLVMLLNIIGSESCG